MQEFCKTISQRFSNCSDFSIREFADSEENRFACVSIDNLSDRGKISSSVIFPILKLKGKSVSDRVSSVEVVEINDFSQCEAALLQGSAVIFSESENKIYKIPARNEDFRSIENAGVEEVVRGPHDSFIEDAPTNVSLLRRRIRNSNFKCIKKTVGSVSKTNVYIVYIEGVASKDVLFELEKRIEKADVEILHDSGTLEMAIHDGAYTVFPLVANTERPDKAAAKLSEGRIAVIVDGSPVVLTVPMLYIETLQSTDDYSKSRAYASFARILRFCAVLCALLLPALYIAAYEYHPELLPGKLLKTLYSTRENVPYGVFGEVVLMLAVFDIIREVGQRMPKAMGSVVSIVAGIVLGDAAMTAGLVSEPTIIVIALSATCAYVSPPVTWTNILLKFSFVFAAHFFGILGVILLFFVLCTYLAQKESFGVPYLSPIAPLDKIGMGDTLIKTKE